MTKHCAKFTPALMPVMGTALRDAGVKPGGLVLDPFAGTGRIHLLWEYGFYTVGIEIEPEWQEMNPRTLLGDATTLPFRDRSFAAVCTSPTYGNRMGDHHNARDASRRNTYTHTLGRKLHPNNSGAMQWGHDYRMLHLRAWGEAWRVLRRNGVLVLNVSNHIRKGVEVDVYGWHLDALAVIGFDVLDEHKVETPRNRHGANGNLRVDHEMVAVLRKVQQ